MKTETKTISGGSVVTTVDIDGTRNTTTVPQLPHTLAVARTVASGMYRTHKVWNPATSAYISVTCTGNDAQDAALLAAAFVTAGVRTDSLISST